MTSNTPSPEGGPENESTGQPNLRQQALALLDFPRVQQILAGHTRFFLAKEQALEMEPQVHLEDVERLQDETEQGVAMLDSVGDIGLAGHDDPRDLLRRAGLDGTLEGSELVSLVGLFDSMWTARDVVVVAIVVLVSAMAGAATFRGAIGRSLT